MTIINGIVGWRSLPSSSSASNHFGALDHVVSGEQRYHHTPHTTTVAEKHILWIVLYVQCVCPVRCKVHTHILRYYLRRPGNILSQSGEHTTQSHYNPPHYWGGLSQGRPHSISITGTQCGGNVVGGREQAEHGQRYHFTAHTYRI